MAIDLMSIPQLARNLNRVGEIARISAKYGVAHGFDKLDRKFLRRWVSHTALAPLTEASYEARIRLALTELGTTFIKLGQMLSTRRDLVGPALADELSFLQSNVPADPFEVTKLTVEAELGLPLETLFARFDETALASASIGQVHRATLHDGREVAVKVQHPDISRRIHNDLSILKELAGLAESYLSEFRPYRPLKLVEEFQRQLLRELDFRREMRHLQIFARNFAKDATVHFPVPLPELSTAKVLTMEFLLGTPLIAVPQALVETPQPAELAERGARVFLDMIFRDGFYHSDPHPGNIMVLADGRLGLFDVGMVGRVDDRLRSQIESAIVAIMTNDAASLTDLVMIVGDTPPHLDAAALQLEITDQLAFYWGMPLDQFQLGIALNELTDAIRRFHILLPPSLALLLKVIVILEGTARLLNPTFNLVEVLEPYRRKFVRRRFNPHRLMRRMFNAAQDWDEVASNLPRAVRDLMSLTRRRQFAIQLQHQHLEPSVNRLVFGLIISALFLGSAVMWAAKAPPLIADISIFGVLGCIVSMVLGFRVFRAIQHSGKLEEE